MSNIETSESPKATVDEFLSSTIVIGRFLRECSALPGFTSDFTFLHWCIVFVVSKEPEGISHKTLCRKVGLSWDYGKEMVKELEVAGAISLDRNAILITDAGLSKLGEANRQLLPLVQTAIENPARLQNVARLWHYIGRSLSNAMKPK